MLRHNRKKDKETCIKVLSPKYFYTEYNNEAKEHIHTSYPSEAHAEDEANC